MFFSVLKKRVDHSTVATGGLNPSKLKYETLKINSAVAIKPACTNVQAPLHKRKAPFIKDILATVLVHQHGWM